nr:MAG TPA: hypothetical protein [Microviridae sp.]
MYNILYVVCIIVCIVPKNMLCVAGGDISVCGGGGIRLFVCNWGLCAVK